MNQLQRLEDELQYKRENYNGVVREYNSMRSEVPMVLFASLLGFREAPYFEVERADSLESLEEFRTDDTALVKQVLAGAAGRLLGSSQKPALGAGSEAESGLLSQPQRGEEEIDEIETIEQDSLASSE